MKIALNGLKYLGAELREFLAETLDDIGFRIRISDPNVWMREATKPTGETYYEYILCYVGDILCIIHDAMQKMGEIQKNLKFKNNKIEGPDLYLYASLKKKELNGQTMWTMTSQDYIKNAIDNL